MTNASNNGAKRNGSVAEAISARDAQTVVNGGPGAAGLELVDGWDSLPPAVTRELAKPLDASLVSQRRGRAGRNYSYIEGHTVIDQANRIFGHGGWGFDLAGEVVLREIENVDPKTGEVRAPAPTARRCASPSPARLHAPTWASTSSPRRPERGMRLHSKDV